MPVAFSNKPNGYSGPSGFSHEAVNATSIAPTTGFTVNSGDTTLVSMISFSSWTVSAPAAGLAMTWDGVSMNNRSQVTHSNNPPLGAQQATTAIFTLESPNVGEKTLSCSYSPAQDCYLSAATFTGSVFDAAATPVTGNTQITINSASDGATIASWASDGAAPTCNFTTIYSEAPNNPAGGASYNIGGTSNTHTFTGGNVPMQAIVGVFLSAKGGIGPLFQGS